MSFRYSATLFAVILFATGNLFADAPKLLRSLSGPSGTIVGSHLEINDPRTRFVFPQDKSLTVYFEWEAAPGAHTLSAIWKQPDGKVVSISPDVKMVSAGPSMNCYWIFSLEDGLPNGVWTVEIRMDGQPAGSHYFEIAGMSSPAPPVSTPAATPEPASPNLDQIFKSITPSLVWIHKLDSSGRRFDTATGFILRPNLIATAFQAIDSASTLEIEFSDGRKVPLSEIASCSRTADWALLKLDTGSRAPLQRGDPAKVAIGQRLIVFNFESSARVIGGVDIAGRRDVPGFGARIQFSPDVATEAAGGPLLNSAGQVVGILGGSLNPAARVASAALMGNYRLWSSLHSERAATPITEIPDNPAVPAKTLAQLDQEGILSARLDSIPELQYAGTASDMPKGSQVLTPREVSSFSTFDPAIFVYSMWIKKGKVSKGEIGVKIYDSFNRLRVTGVPRRISLSDNPERVSLSFAPSSFQAGIYRIDILWNDRAVWRGFIKIQN